MIEKMDTGMVIGSGVIAQRFRDYALQSRYLLFAGFVHDSTIQDVDLLAFDEAALNTALSTHAHATFIYFSSCSVADTAAQPSLYRAHKLRMEELVASSANRYLILRLPQLMGLNDEPTSLVNHVVNSITAGTSFEIWSGTTRNLIDIDDVYRIVHAMLTGQGAQNRIMNVASPKQTSVLELVQVVEDYFGKKALCVAVDKSVTSVSIDVAAILPIVESLEIDFNDGYLKKSIDKYYQHRIKPPILLSIIVPTYNEVHGIEEFYRRTKAVLDSIKPRFDHEIIFVNDHSSDRTYEKLSKLANRDSKVKLIDFSRNFGNQIGIAAGIDFAEGDVAVIIDDDLQDPPEVMLNFIMKWCDGYKVVYGVRPKREGVNWLFQLLAKIYYRLIGALSDTAIPNDTGDFRLIDRVVIDQLRLMREESRYYRGMVAWVGFRQVGWVYRRDSRYAGTSGFSFKKYVNFALTGLTSFSERPLYFSSVFGLVITALGFAACSYLLVLKLLDPSLSIRGWTSLIAIVVFFGGIQLLSIGVIGVYLGRVFREVKGRPLYIIDSTTNIAHDRATKSQGVARTTHRTFRN